MLNHLPDWLLAHKKGTAFAGSFFTCNKRYIFFERLTGYYARLVFLLAGCINHLNFCHKGTKTPRKTLCGLRVPIVETGHALSLLSKILCALCAFVPSWHKCIYFTFSKSSLSLFICSADKKGPELITTR